MRILKWVAIVIGGLIGLCVIAALVILWFVDANRFRPEIESRVRAATGRELALTGEIQLHVFPWLSLGTGEGSFGNAPGFGSEPMARWQSLRVGARLMPLLRGEFEVGAIELVGADIRLHRRADGHANWEGIGGNAPANPEAKPLQLRIAGVSIEKSRLTFIDETVPRTVRVDELVIETGAIALDDPFTDTKISGRVFMDGFAAAGVPFRLEVPEFRHAENFAKLGVQTLQLQVAGLELEAAVYAELAEKTVLKGEVKTRSFDLKSFLGQFGIEPPKTSDPAALTRVQLTATWQFDAGAVQVTPLALSVDDTNLTGQFSRDAGAQAVGEFALHGDRIDLVRYVPPPNPDSEPFKLPTAALKELRFRGTLEFEEVKYEDTLLKGARLTLVLDEQGLHGK